MHLNTLRGPKRGLKRLIYELPNVPRLNPRSTKTHVNLAGGQVVRLCGAEGIDVDAVRLVALGGGFGFTQFLAHVAREVFIRCNIVVCAWYAEDNALQFGGYFVLTFAAKFRHIWQFHASLFIHGNRQRFNLCLRVLDRSVRLDSALGEHI